MAATSKYWCTESLLVIVSGPQGSSTVAVDKPFARIGSHPRSEVVLTGNGIDARCLYLHATLEGVFCVQLSATGEGVPGSGRWLRPQEVITVGPYNISISSRGGSQPPPRVALTVWGSAPFPLPVCEILSDQKNRVKRRFRARLNLIGRRRELALQMQGLQVSSCHCALYWEAGQLWCVDLLSSNGTQLHDRSIDCEVVELGESLQIGEFVLLFKRLSHSSAQTAWRTEDSDSDVLDESTSQSAEMSPPGSIAQTTAASSGDTAKGPPNVARPEAASARSHLSVSDPQSKENDLVQFQAEFAQRSEQLMSQREQLEQQWQLATQQVASQVNQLQSESALLAAQRQQIVQLRADWDEQHRILMEDLKSWKRELSQRQSLLDGRAQEIPGDEAKTRSFTSEDDPEVRVGAAHQSDAELAIFSVPESPASRSPLPPSGLLHTVIEGSYVVEREPRRSHPAARQSTFEPARMSAQPIGRRRSADLPAEPPVPTAPELPPAELPSLLQNSGTEVRELSVVQTTPSGTVISTNAGKLRKLPFRRKPADDDRMGAFVTDRLVLREAARRFRLRVLLGVAGTISLLALATLAYIVLTRSG